MSDALVRELRRIGAILNLGACYSAADRIESQARELAEARRALAQRDGLIEKIRPIVHDLKAQVAAGGYSPPQWQSYAIQLYAEVEIYAALPAQEPKT